MHDFFPKLELSIVLFNILNYSLNVNLEANSFLLLSLIKSTQSSIYISFYAFIGKRDTCLRPTATYNENYNPYEPPKLDLPFKYSPYTSREPLFNNRLPLIKRFPKKYTLVAVSKRGFQSQVWQLGYALTKNSKPHKPTIWECKLYRTVYSFYSKSWLIFYSFLGYYDIDFANKKKQHFDANILRSAKKHLLD